MGNSSSLFSAGAHSELLERFSGSESVAIGDSFWRALLTFGVPLTKFDPELLQQSLADTLDQLAANNGHTLHFQKLLVHVLRLVQSVRKAPQRAPQATNALLFTRMVVAHFTERLGSEELQDLASTPPGFMLEAANAKLASGELPLLQQFVAALLTALSSYQLSSATYLFQLELRNLLIVLCSTQLYTPHTTAYPGAHPFAEVLMQQAAAAPLAVQALLQYYCERPPLPARAPLFVPPPPGEAGSTGSTVIRFVRSAAASVLWLPYTAFTLLVRSSAASSSPLADTGEVLLLMLACHAPAAGLLPANPFRAALQQLQDADDRGSDAESGLGQAAEGAAAVSFSALYDALGQRLVNERSVLLLYLLLQGCQRFQEYALVRADLDTLLLPLLRMLYASDRRTPSQMYMLLIIVLLLSQDAAFAANVHRIAVGGVPWYKERVVMKTTLGSLLTVVLLRTAHYNLAKLRDVYMQTNTLAALTNLAPHMAGLTSHASQRLVSLFDMVSRRHQKLAARDAGAAAAAPPPPDGALPPTANGGGADSGAPESQVFADFTRIILEVINCVLTSGLAANPQLVYALLHRQEVFAPFRSQPYFADLTQNVFLVLDFFNTKVEEARGDPKFEWSVEAVLSVINSTVNQVRWSERLRQFQDLRFTYEEEADAEAFFVPLVWSMIVADTALPWRHAAIVLFTPAPASARTESSSSVFDPHEFNKSLSLDEASGVRLAEELQSV